MSILDEIKLDTTSNPVVLYMKGTKEQPMCGFSAMAVQILNQLGIKFQDRNVLADEALRQGIKDYSDWPTIPQLYVNGEFIGGCDIMREMYESGELAELFKSVSAA